MKRFLLLLSSAFLCGIILPGCVIIHGETRTSSGSEIPAEKFAQVVPGQKSTAVVELLGDPVEKTAEDGGGELWQWHYRETATGSSWFLLIPLGDHQTKTEKTYTVEFKDGTVTKAWSE